MALAHQQRQQLPGRKSQDVATHAADASENGAKHLAGVAATQHILGEAAPGWDGVDPVPPGGEIWVKCTMQYHHAGVYIGNGWVVHVDAWPTTLAWRLLHGAAWAKVVESSLATFSGGAKVTAGPTPATRSADVVIAEALSWVGRALPYNPVTDNCQHFSSRIVSGVANSPEAEGVMAAWATTAPFIP
jgi:hypothetical protein